VTFDSGGQLRRSAPSWSPPAYPYDRLVPLRRAGASLPGGLVDLSVGTPGDPPPSTVLAALADADRDGAARGYPPSAGSPELRAAASAWIESTFGVEVPIDAVAACVGTKELVATTPAWLARARPGRDTVLYPAVSYPTYAMGAALAGLRAVPVAVDDAWRLDLGSVSEADARRALLLWLDSPGNPAGALEDLTAAAAWGRDHDVAVFSDECYAEFTWRGEPATILGRGAGPAGLGGVVAVHSLSKRSNLAGLRVGWYAGDPDLVGYLSEVRKHAGLMIPGPAQRAAVAALGERAHVAEQRRRYRHRLELVADALRRVGSEIELPAGGFYLWAAAPGGDAWAWTELLATRAGVLGSPGEFYGPGGAGFVRFAMVAPDERIALALQRLAGLVP
jgi:succinyldiaminopimelate transaminase